MPSQFKTMKIILVSFFIALVPSKEYKFKHMRSACLFARRVVHGECKESPASMCHAYVYLPGQPKQEAFDYKSPCREYLDTEDTEYLNSKISRYLP